MGLVPILTVGLPVFQGGRYLAAAVESILSQSFTDLELIISDNASTDDTQAIGPALAASDPRVTYRRNAENIGLSANFNLLVPLARGRLFKWATADDLLRPGYLARCVSAIDSDPTVVLAYPGTDFVDADGVRLALSDPGWHLVSDDPSVRLSFAIRAGHFVNASLGVIRTDALRRTRLLPQYAAGDYRLMAELALLGKFVEIPAHLYVRRIHTGSTKGNAGDAAWLARYHSGSRPSVRAAYWRLSVDQAVLVIRSSIPASRKVVLLSQLARTVVLRRRLLFRELLELLRA